MLEKDLRASSPRWLRIAAIWCAGGLFDASQTILIMPAEGRHHPWPRLSATELVSWLPWVLATPMVVGLARRRPLLHGLSLRSVFVHLAAFEHVGLIAGLALAAMPAWRRAPASR